MIKNYKPHIVEFFHAQCLEEFHKYRNELFSNELKLDMVIDGISFSNIVVKAKKKVYSNYGELNMETFLIKLFDLCEKCQVGIELTPNNAIFITIVTKQDLEIHIEYFLNKVKYDKSILFNIFEGDKSIATSWDNPADTLKKLQKYTKD